MIGAAGGRAILTRLPVWDLKASGDRGADHPNESRASGGRSRAFGEWTKIFIATSMIDIDIFI